MAIETQEDALAEARRRWGPEAYAWLGVEGWKSVGTWSGPKGRRGGYTRRLAGWGRTWEEAFEAAERSEVLRSENPRTDTKTALRIQYLTANQAWALMWHDHILGIYNRKKDAEWEKGILERGVGEGRVTATRASNPTLMVIGNPLAVDPAGVLRKDGEPVWEKEPREWASWQRTYLAIYLADTKTTPQIRRLQDANRRQTVRAYRAGDTRALENLQALFSVYAEAVGRREFPADAARAELPKRASNPSLMVIGNPPALKVGDRVYYTGDMANQPGEGTVTAVRPPSRFAPLSYDIRLDDGGGETGDEPRVIGGLWATMFEPQPGRRFWPLEEWLEERRKKIEAMQRSFPKRKNPDAADWVDIIRPGDRVTIVNRFGQERTGRAVMRSSVGGWVLNMGGAHGTPGLADNENIVAVKQAKGPRKDDHLGRFLHGRRNPGTREEAEAAAKLLFGERGALDTIVQPGGRPPIYQVGVLSKDAKRFLPKGRGASWREAFTDAARSPNPPSPALERAYETFHNIGADAAEVLRIPDVAGVPREVMALGTLVEVGVSKSGSRGYYQPRQGRGRSPLLVYSPKDGTLYAIPRSGVLEDLDELHGMRATSVTYRPHRRSAKDPADYQHDFERPLPVLKAVGGRALAFEGGGYKVSDWIHD